VKRLRLCFPQVISSRKRRRDPHFHYLYSYPSKSGVIGLLCAALGKPRDENHPDNYDQPKLEALAALRMGVRVNREGVPQKDYHTAGGSRHDDYGVIQSDGKGRRTIESTRYYLNASK
jgi:CRISPR system Cascade subunit CasD